MLAVLKLLHIIGASAAAFCVAAGTFAALRSARPSPLRVLDARSELPADGRFHRVGVIPLMNHGEKDAAAFAASGLPARFSLIDEDNAEWAVQSPVLQGDHGVRISYAGATTALKIHFARSVDDAVGDGTPDYLRLHTAEDRSAFRGWFTALAEAAADTQREQLPPEIDDCAALLRWCYRNALHAHDEAWLSQAPQALQLTQASVRQYAYPLTPLGAALFRVKEGTFESGDETSGAFAQFADARTLWRLNTFFVGRDVRSARPGDLLFFRQLEQNSQYHSMIVAGTTETWLIYDTGPIGRAPGEMRRVLLQDLLKHPDQRWRPISTNTNFLGVYRWNILQEDAR